MDGVEVKNRRILMNLLQKQLGDFKSKYPLEWQNILNEYPKLKIYDNNLSFVIVNDSFVILAVGLPLKYISWFSCNYEYKFKKETKFYYQCYRQSNGNPNYTHSDSMFCHRVIPKLFPRFTMEPYCNWIEIETK